MSMQVNFKVSPCKGKPHMKQEIRELLQRYDWTERITDRLVNRYADWIIMDVDKHEDNVSFKVSFKNGKTAKQDVRLGLYEMIQNTPTIKVREIEII